MLERREIGHFTQLFFCREQLRNVLTVFWTCVKAVANEDTMLRTHCCGHKCFPVCPRAQHLLRTQNLSPRPKNVSDFFQKHFVSPTNVSQFAQHRNNREQQCVRKIVSSFATTFIIGSLSKIRRQRERERH